MRLPLLLLLSIALSCAAPINQELAAKKFYSKLFNLYTQEKHGELFDAISEKFDNFFPGIYTSDDRKTLRAAFIDYKNKGEANEDAEFIIDPIIRKRASSLVMERLAGLNEEAQTFMMKAVEESANGITDVRQVVSKFASFRAKYDALDSSTKKSLASNFEIFNRLDEVQALITVADNLFGAVMTLCDNLPEFNECVQIKEAFVKDYDV